jgi:hypothetical protein
VKRKVAFRELEPVLRAAVARGAVAVPESEAPRLESAARPDLPLIELLRELSAGLRLPNEGGVVVRSCERRLEAVPERDFPERPGPGERLSRHPRPRGCSAGLRPRHVRRLHGRHRAPDRSRRPLPLRALHRRPRGRRTASQTAKRVSPARGRPAAEPRSPSHALRACATRLRRPRPRPGVRRRGDHRASTGRGGKPSSPRRRLRSSSCAASSR